MQSFQNKRPATHVLQAFCSFSLPYLSLSAGTSFLPLRIRPHIRGTSPLYRPRFRPCTWPGGHPCGRTCTRRVPWLRFPGSRPGRRRRYTSVQPSYFSSCWIPSRTQLSPDWLSYLLKCQTSRTCSVSWLDESSRMSTSK